MDGFKIEFPTEAALCQAFIASVPPEWVVYPETQNWDLLLVHRVGGWQIGIEAKKTLNAKVIAQAIAGIRRDIDGPDFRAVLVGSVNSETATIARALGLTVITHAGPRMARCGKPWKGHTWDPTGPHLPTFKPDLPEAKKLIKIGDWWSDWHHDGEWLDHFPTHRHKLPDYVPEVAAGVPSPMILSDWKIKAMRVCQWIDKNGTITRAQFKALGIDPSRWMNGVWLSPGNARGIWIKGPRFPGDQFRREHPSIWDKIAADFDKWSEKVPR